MVFTKVVAVLGSPHEQGPSTTLVNRILQGARDAGHETVVYEINKMNVKGCQGCRACKKAGIDCVVQDDLQPYWRDLHQCGALIVSSPNYCAQVCDPMITYMNRHYCLLDANWKTRLEPGKKLIGVFAQGGAETPPLAQQNYEWFLGDFRSRGMQLVDTLIHTGGTSLVLDSELMQRAYALGKSL